MRLKSFVKQIAAAAAAAVAVVPLGVSGEEGSTRPMTLAESIGIALEHNLDIQIERINPLIAEANRKMVYGDYDPVATLRASHDYNQNPGGLDAQQRPFQGSSADTDALSASLSGLLPSGMTYSISSFAADTYGTAPRSVTIGTNFIVLRDAFENTRAQFMVGELRQPLLRNFWIDGTRLNLRLRSKDLKVSDLNLRMRILNTVSSVEQAYYDLIASRENVKSAEIAYQLAKKLYEDNKKKVEVGTMAQLDERQAQAQMAANEAAVIEAQRSVDFVQNQLKTLLSDDYEKWHPVTIVPQEKLEAIPEDLDVQKAWNQAFQLRPDLLAMIIDLERRDLITRFTRNQLFPQLDIFGAIGWVGNGSEFSDALGQVSEGSAPMHNYGAVLTFPLSNRRARQSYRVSRDERAQAELRLRQFRQQVMVGVSDAIQQAQSSFQRVGATRSARQFAEEALSAEEKKMANGKSTSFEVLRLQRDLTQARFDETRAFTDYNRALAILRQRQGTSLLKFDLETPPPAMTLDPAKK